MAETTESAWRPSGGDVRIPSAAIYARVSTSSQDVDVQLRELREYSARRHWTVVGEYLDEGASGSVVSRPGLNRLMTAARRRAFDIVLVGPYFKILAALELYNTLTGLVIAYVTICLPFAAWMAKGHFDSIPREIDEAGRVAGASHWQVLWRLVRADRAAGDRRPFLFGFLLAWQDLLWALTLVAMDDKRTVTLGIAFTVGEFIVDWPMLTAACLIGSLPTLVLYLALQRFYVEGLAGGAVKG